MAALKDFYDRPRVERLAAELKGAWAPFDAAGFTAAALQGLDGLELQDRARHIAFAMAAHLPRSFKAALAVVLASLGPPLAKAEGNGMEPFHYQPHTFFVAAHGLGHVALSLDAQRELTRRCSCEFSMRPFLVEAPKQTMAWLRAHVNDPDEHVRRLVSECTRPRLPWAARLVAFVDDPSPTLPLLEALRDDPSPYVRRSVANHLNDISKDHPELVLALAKRWWKPSRRPLIAHALRSLVKQGDPTAIALLGGAGDAEVGLRLPPSAAIGDDLPVVVGLDARATGSAILALRVHFIKADGSSRPRTFRLPTRRLAVGERVEVRTTVRLAQLSTRRHYPGRHEVEVVLNGKVAARGSFRLVAAP